MLIDTQILHRRSGGLYDRSYYDEMYEELVTVSAGGRWDFHDDNACKQYGMPAIHHCGAFISAAAQLGKSGPNLLLGY